MSSPTLIRPRTLMAIISLHLTLRRHQAEVFLCGKRFIVLVAGRRWGKTTLAIWYLVVNACGNKDRICYYVAPTYGQAKRIAWRLLRQLVRKKACRRVNEQELLIELLNGSIIQLHGADRPDRLRGVGLDCVVLDEFADMRVETMELRNSSGAFQPPRARAVYRHASRSQSPLRSLS